MPPQLPVRLVSAPAAAAGFVEQATAAEARSRRDGGSLPRADAAAAAASAPLPHP